MKYKIFSACAAAAVIMAAAGCGQAGLDDEFVFGKNRISCANETITIEVPFEMGIQGKMADLAPKDLPKVNAEGHNPHMQILVTGERAGGKTVEAQAEAASAMMRGNPTVSGLKEERNAVRIGNTEGIRMTFVFTVAEKNRSADLTVKEYIFPQNDTLWRVIYQYRTNDPVGKALTERVEGKIVQGATF